MSSNKKSTTGILNKTEWGQCDTRPMSDAERLRYGRRRPTLKEWNEIIKDPIKTKQVQNTYDYSDDDIAGIRTCLSQQGWEQGIMKVPAKKKIEGISAMPEVVNGKEVLAMRLHGEKAIRL